MARIILILVIAAIVESIGVAFLSGGLKEINGVKEVTASEMLSKRDVSFIWPMTSLGFIFTTLAAGMFLHEKVSPARWAGVVLIALGAGLASYSESVKEQPGGSSPPPAASATFHPE